MFSSTIASNNNSNSTTTIVSKRGKIKKLENTNIFSIRPSLTYVKQFISLQLERL
jgi:hypothetical protein